MSEKPIKTHQRCPECGHDKCLSIWADGGMRCHSCGFKKGKDRDDSVHYGEDPNIVESKIVPYRNLTKETLEVYGTTTGFNAKGEEVRREYHYPDQIKKRYLPKDFSKNKGFKANKLFGMDKFAAGSAKTLTITEGEDDAPAAYQMLGGKPSMPVVSLPSASISSELIRECTTYLNSFKEIILCTDNDDAGKAAAKRLATAFPNKVYLVPMTKHKDAQEFLEAGEEREFFFAWNNRKKHTPSGFWNRPDQFTDILTRTESHEFVPTPIEALNDVISGLMKGHLTVLTGPEGQGKTEILRLFEYDILKNHKDMTIGVLHMEESQKTCLESYACYELGKNIRDPEHKVPQVRINEAINELTKDHNLFLFDFGIDEDPLSILDKVRYLAVACECDYIFLDPIQQLAYGQSRDQSEEQVLSQISVQLERLATDLNVGIVMTTHVNDDGQTRSSRMIGKSASVRLDLNRDHMNTDPDIRNTTRLSVSKNRPTGATGYGGELTFDPTSFTLAEKFV